MLISTVLAIGFRLATIGAQDAKVQQGTESVHGSEVLALPFDWRTWEREGSARRFGTRLSADEIRQWIADAKGMTATAKAIRKPGMKQYTLPKEDVDALVTYLQTLKGKK